MTRASDDPRPLTDARRQAGLSAVAGQVIPAIIGRMEFRILIKVDGDHTGLAIEGAPPDGRYDIRGVQTAAGLRLQVVIRDGAGRYVTHAEHNPIE